MYLANLHCAVRQVRIGVRSVCSGLLGAALTLAASATGAQTATAAPLATPGVGAAALPAIVDLGVPTPSNAPLAAAAGLGYGWIDSGGGVSGGSRMSGQLAMSYAPLPALAFGANLAGRWDRYSGAAGSGAENNEYGEPRLLARYSASATEALTWGAQLDLRFIGGNAPSIELGATTPALRGLFAWHRKQTWVSAELGFMLDRTAEAVPTPSRMTLTDKQTLGASSSNAALWGIGVSHRLQSSRTELLGEIAGQALVGAQSPELVESPWHVGLAARQPFGSGLALLAAAQLSLSERPPSLAGADLIPIEPRVGFGLTLSWQYEPPPPPVRVEREPEPKAVTAPVLPKPEPTPPPVELRTYSGTVVDEGGRPLADVEVKLLQKDQEPRTAQTAADGSFSFDGVPNDRAHPDKVELVTTSTGFDSVTVAVESTDTKPREIVMRPAVPAGQVRGRVLDLQGHPVTAKIHVSPGDVVIDVQPDGSFELELAPGTYTVKFEHADFSPQQRKIQVYDRGVVILNIGLIR